MNTRTLAAGLAMATLVTQGASGVVTLYHYNQEPAWEQAVGTWETIDFTDLEPAIWISDEYLDSHGVQFENGFIQAVPSETSFLHDGFGFTAIGSAIDVVFSEPVMAFALDLPGNVLVQPFLGDEPLADELLFGLTGPDRFGGITSDVPFDRVRIRDTDGGFAVDDLRFANVVPSPATFLWLGVWTLWRGRRRSA